MKRTAKPLILIAGLAFSASMAQAITVADVVQTYRDAAYSGIEVKESPNQIKVEGVKDGVKVEVVYDKATGDVIKRESEAAGVDDSNSGLEVSSTDHDFTGDDRSDDDISDDGPDHDAGDDHGGSGHDDSGDDDSGDDDSGDDDSGDDDSGDDDSGDDDSGDDDSGHDDGGHDDSGHGGGEGSSDD